MRAWRKQLDHDSAMSQDVQAGPFEAWPPRKDKGKQRAKVQNQTEVQTTSQNVAFEGLNGLDCRKWWNENPDTHLVKASIQKAQVEWAIWMPVFYIRDFEGILCIMIEAYDRHSHRSSVPYLGYDVVVSFRPADFTRVFGIPGTTQG